jgi:hypothetical protein
MYAYAHAPLFKRRLLTASLESTLGSLSGFLTHSQDRQRSSAYAMLGNCASYRLMDYVVPYRSHMNTNAITRLHCTHAMSDTSYLFYCYLRSTVGRGHANIELSSSKRNLPNLVTIPSLQQLRMSCSPHMDYNSAEKCRYVLDKREMSSHARICDMLLHQ